MATSLIQSDPDDEVNEGANVDSPTNEFFDAIFENNIEKVKKMFAKGFTALSRSSYGDMALYFACLSSKLDALQLLKDTLKEGEINTINIEDDSICGTALHMSMDGQVDALVAKPLLSFGADPNALDAKGSPVLHELILRAFDDLEDDFECEAYMKSFRNSRNEESEEIMGTSYFEKLKFLHEYGANMNLRILDSLIENGANVEIQDKHGSTPLHHAVHVNNHTAIQRLLHHRASVEIKDKFERTVRDLTRIEGDSEVQKIMGISVDLSDYEILSRVSGVRLSRFYPLCCQKTYSEDSRGVEEPEVVKDTDIDKWLEKYPLCIHNTKAILQNSISSLETNLEQRTSRMRDNCRGGRGSTAFRISRLKVLCLEKLVKYGLEDLIDNEGFLNRSVWYGPFEKRQIMNVDIVPVFRLNDWQTTYVNSNLRIVDKQTATSVGCYLIMKDPTPYFDDADAIGMNVKESAPTEANGDCVQGDLLFKLSLTTRACYYEILAVKH
ncbi:hypothetical protein CHS0354_005594 [Potamilus streckersoni]|uniref:Ankyrin repeat protein n=1 Tax=Potamilus streckersoni TaxID=2493646 RepID=A0AAE0SIC8_9BIVA|nr:hypothetical protein CHS0354_005594 [Potamilus streckersoni]